MVLIERSTILHFVLLPLADKSKTLPRMDTQIGVLQPIVQLLLAIHNVEIRMAPIHLILTVDKVNIIDGIKTFKQDRSWRQPLHSKPQ